jgi:hypothetical protein
MGFMPLILGLRRPKQKDHKFEVRPCYLGSLRPSWAQKKKKEVK